MKKYHLLLGSKITSYWLLVKKRIFLEQVVQDLEQVVQEKISAFQALDQFLGTLTGRGVSRLNYEVPRLSKLHEDARRCSKDFQQVWYELEMFKVCRDDMPCEVKKKHMGSFGGCCSLGSTSIKRYPERNSKQKLIEPGELD